MKVNTGFLFMLAGLLAAVRFSSLNGEWLLMTLSSLAAIAAMLHALPVVPDGTRDGVVTFLGIVALLVCAGYMVGGLLSGHPGGNWRILLAWCTALALAGVAETRL